MRWAPQHDDLHWHGTNLHEHARGDDDHRHVRNGKTYWKHETRSDGTPVKCEGHWSVEFDITNEWCYRKE